MIAELTGKLKGYYVTSSGDVLSDKPTGRFGDDEPGKMHEMKKRINKYGYYDVGLRYNDKNGNRKKRMFEIHRLVAKEFIANDKNLPVVNHIDNDKLNNKSDNLEWCTVRYNTAHHVVNCGSYAVMGEANATSVLRDSDIPEIMGLHGSGERVKDIADKFGVHRSTINNVVHGYQWNHITGLPCKKDKYKKPLGKQDE